MLGAMGTGMQTASEGASWLKEVENVDLWKMYRFVNFVKAKKDMQIQPIGCQFLTIPN